MTLSGICSGRWPPYPSVQVLFGTHATYSACTLAAAEEGRAHRSDSVSVEYADEHPGVDYSLPFGYLLQDLAVWFDGGNIEGWLLNGAFLLLSGVSQTSSTGVLFPHCYEPVLKSFLWDRSSIDKSMKMRPCPLNMCFHCGFPTLFQ